VRAPHKKRMARKQPAKATFSIDDIDALVVACRAMADHLRGGLATNSDPRLRKLTRESSDRYTRLAGRLQRIRPVMREQVLECRLSSTSLRSLPEESVDRVLASGTDNDHKEAVD
jgi:hypothetical protein